MTRTFNPLLYWAPAIMLSLLAHATLVMIIQQGTAPDPVSMTEEIRTRIDMSSLEVPSQRAEAQDAEGELAESAEPSGERLGVQAVPSSRARPVAATAQTVAALAATTPVTRPTTARQAAMAAISPAGDRLAATAPTVPNLASATAQTTSIVPTATPSTVAAVSPTPPGEALATVRPDDVATLEAAAARAPVLAAAVAPAPVLAASTAAPAAIAATAPPADTLAVTESRGSVAVAVQPPSVTMAAAAIAAEIVSGARPSGTELAPVGAVPDRLSTVVASGESVAPARPAAEPVSAQIADSTTLIATVGTAPAVAARPPPATLMAAAAVPAQILPGARPSGIELAPVTAETALLTTVTANGASVASAKPSFKPVVAQAAEATALIATVSAAPAVAALPPPTTLMAAAAVPAQIMPGARPSGAELAPVTAATDRLDTVVASGESVAPAKPSARPVVAKFANPTALLATVSTGPAVAARPPPNLLMAAVAAPAQTVAGGRPRGQQVASRRPAPEPMATVDSGRPDIAAPAAIAVPQATELAANTTSDIAGFVAPTSTTQAAVVATAALAWTGDAETALDEQSLAAIQSFMRPGDVASSAAFAGSVRDGIAAALAQFPCSRLQAAFQPDTGGLEIRGHVPTPGMRTAVVGMLEKRVGASIPVGGSVLVLPEPQCDVLDIVEQLGLPQSVDQAGDPLVIGEEAQARIERREEGERLTLPLRGAEYDAYIYVDYYDAGGKVIHLMPNELDTDNRVEANRLFKIGEDESGLKLTIAPPFGQDIAVILATTSPLYDGSLPLTERADKYLPWLHARIDAFSAADPDFRGEWVYHFVLTGPVGAFANR